VIAGALWRAAFWAGLISLDITGFGPWMVSQPLVAGPIFGWLMGQVKVGVVIGGITQLLWMDVTPVGVGIPFDTNAVTLLAVYWACLHPACPVPMMMLVLIAAVPFGYVFCWMDTYSRRLNTWGARRLEAAPDAYLPLALELGIGAGLVWTWLRYAGFYALIFWLGERFWVYAQRYTLPEWANQGLTLAAYLCPIAGLGVALELFLTEDPERRVPSLKSFKSRN
jgi:mannose/fructose/N-acetylgalactosamine-specific phosphotransferase system component IIC